MERTLILIKPDAIARGLAGTILKRFENKGLKIAGIKMIQLNDSIIQKQYSHLSNQPFFPTYTKFMSLLPIIAICLEGIDAVEVCRNMCGNTNSRKASPNTIRGEFSMSRQANLIHASDSKDNANKEINIFFKNEELYDYIPPLINYLLATDEF